MQENTREIEVILPDDDASVQKMNIPNDVTYYVHLVQCIECEKIYAEGSLGKLEVNCKHCQGELDVIDWIDFNQEGWE